MIFAGIRSTAAAWKWKRTQSGSREEGELLTEIDKISECVQEIETLFGNFCELFEILKGNEYFLKIGKCGTHIELARLFYKEIVRKAKNKYGIGKGLIRSDPYRCV